MCVMQMWKQLYHWRTFEMLLINCEINLMVTWSANCVTCEADRAIIFAIADPKLFILVVTSFCKAFVNNSSRGIELSKTEKSKMLDH